MHLQKVCNTEMYFEVEQEDIYLVNYLTFLIAHMKMKQICTAQLSRTVSFSFFFSQTSLSHTHTHSPFISSAEIPVSSAFKNSSCLYVRSDEEDDAVRITGTQTHTFTVTENCLSGAKTLTY